MKRLTAYISIFTALACLYPVAVTLFEIRSVPFVIAIAGHIFSTILFTLGIFLLTSKKSRREKRANVWWLYVLTLSAVLPLYGIAVSLFIFIAQKIVERRPPPIVSDEVTVADPEVFEHAPTRLRQLEVLERLDIEPFVDIFKSGATELKKSAVKLLGNIRSRKAINALMIALMDEDVEVSLFAAGVLGMIEDEFAKEMKAKATKYKLHPGDKALGLQLASFYLSYAESGLLDSVAQVYYFGETLRLLNELGNDADIVFLKAKTNFLLGQMDIALELAKKCLAHDPENSTYYALLLETLFAKRDFTEMEARIEAAAKYPLEGDAKNIATFWAKA